MYNFFILLVSILTIIITIGGGIFMDGMWYQYPYILVTYTIGLILIVKINRFYLKNINKYERK